MAVADVHLHELGGHDTVVDIVGVCAALHHLGVSDLYVAAPLPMGRGTVHSRHGVLPLPAPATAALLAGALTVGSDLVGETVTPTAAALLKALGARWDTAPAMRLEAHRLRGRHPAPRRPAERRRGAAGPSGRRRRPAVRELRAETLTELQTTVDDVSGEVIGHVLERALAAGALDAWVAPVLMKKSRPGQVLHVLARPADADRLRTLVLAETGSLGIRSYPVVRHAAARSVRRVIVDGHAVRVKIGPVRRETRTRGRRGRRRRARRPDPRGRPARVEGGVAAMTLDQRGEELLAAFDAPVAVAFSGGADSALVLAAAVRALGPADVLAVTAVSASYPAGELVPARRFAEELAVRHELADTHETEVPGYRANGTDRCWFCKSEVLDVVAARARANTASGWSPPARTPTTRATRSGPASAPATSAGSARRCARSGSARTRSARCRGTGGSPPGRSRPPRAWPAASGTASR